MLFFVIGTEIPRVCTFVVQTWGGEAQVVDAVLSCFSAVFSLTVAPSAIALTFRERKLKALHPWVLHETGDSPLLAGQCIEGRGGFRRLAWIRAFLEA